MAPTLSSAGDPRFSRLFNTVLGSPFLTTAEPLPHLELEAMGSNAHTSDHRPASPTPTADFSIIDMDPEDVDPNPFIPGSYPTGHSRLISSSIPSLTFSRGRQMSTWAGTSTNYAPTRDRQYHPQHSSSLKSLLPRLWDALSSPGRTMLSLSPSMNVNSTSPPSSRSSSRTASPSASPHHLPPQSWYAHNGAPNGRHSPVYWYNGSNGKCKGKAKANDRTGSRSDLDEKINYSELPPLDGEEGELIDEACFIDPPDVTGIDILSKLPPELALHILTFICPPPLPPSAFYLNTSASPGRSRAISNEGDTAPHEALKALLSCRLVSHTWCRLASDNAVWRALFLGRWNIDLRRAVDTASGTEGPERGVRATMGKTWDFNLLDITPKARRVLGLGCIDAPPTSAPLQLDWRMLYRERLELDMRWAGAAHGAAFGHDSAVAAQSTRRMGGVYNGSFLGVPSSVSGGNFEMADTCMHKTFEPKLMKVGGHTDSVYCLEFDSRRIITGSRDRTIKVWSLRTGECLGTFSGVHRGSVLCLKFEQDWDREWEDHSLSDAPRDCPGNPKTKEETRQRKGFMVSGSSDCSICVWDLHLGPLVESDDVSVMSDEKVNRRRDDGDRTVEAEVKTILKGHSGGVLDLRIDRRWIVSCSKDAVIRVWNRETLELHRTLRGHEGPVNAVGLQSGKVVSASGDGKMILWDIESGERLRTFEGHDRGLACIEFKDDFIVSGSNDCKIKVWSASTGECLRTLVGHEALVRALSFDPRTGRLVSASYDKSVKLWDLGSGKLVREFKGPEGHTSHIFDVKFDVARIVSTSHDQKIVVLDFSVGLDAALFV
ncbi:hypothetical protein NLJ89_g1652 [Agrocybe chaxingu]|uniref:Uncharacterized protein n=1 Tax=Agrocybe chaxingu TaxID=84603 RepID=A0A9W8TEU5_9AGAR|nr:hypothetical protein NLJ89_g1652 [Agrocybe chaxingu]